MDALNAMVLLFVVATVIIVITVNIAVHLLNKYETRHQRL